MSNIREFHCPSCVIDFEIKAKEVRCPSCRTRKCSPLEKGLVKFVHEEPPITPVEIKTEVQTVEINQGVTASITQAVTAVNETKEENLTVCELKHKENKESQEHVCEHTEKEVEKLKKYYDEYLEEISTRVRYSQYTFCILLLVLVFYLVLYLVIRLH